MSGIPACCGVILARREMRNSRTSARLSMLSTVRRFRGAWDALSVHLSTETPTAGIGFAGAADATEGLDRRPASDRDAIVPPLSEEISCVVLSCTPPVMSESRSVPTRGSSSRPTRSSGCPRPASAARICGPTAASKPIEGPSPMGHEYAGIVEEVGSAVTTVKPGQFVVGSFFASDNTCEICRAGYQSSCIHREPVGPNGAQAELLRVPLADGTLVATPRSPPTIWCPAAGRLRCPGHRLVRRRRRRSRARQDRRRRRRRRGRACSPSCRPAAGRGADHRDEPARAPAEAGPRVRRHRHRHRARRRGSGRDQGADRRARARTR